MIQADPNSTPVHMTSVVAAPSSDHSNSACCRARSRNPKAASPTAKASGSQTARCGDSKATRDWGTGAPPTSGPPCAIDWGTTSARAYRLDATGAVLATRSAPLGIQSVADRQWIEALDRLLDDWRGLAVPNHNFGRYRDGVLVDPGRYLDLGRPLPQPG